MVSVDVKHHIFLLTGCLCELRRERLDAGLTEAIEMELGVKIPWDSSVLPYVHVTWLTRVSLIRTITLKITDVHKPLCEVKAG